MHRVSLILCLAALTMPASADECDAYREAIDVYKATSSVLVNAGDMIVAAQRGARATRAVEDALKDAQTAAAITMSSAREDVNAAANAVLKAKAATLTVQQEVSIEIARGVRDAILEAARDTIDEAKALLAERPPRVVDTRASSDTFHAAVDAYDKLVLALACR